MPALQIGKRAPAFRLLNQDGKPVQLKKIKAKHIVLYFYPKDDTPGCTLEGKEFSKLIRNFNKVGAVVFGISGGDDAAKAKFCKKHKLSVPLLADTKFKVCKSFGVYGKKKFMGREYMGIKRETFILGPDRTVVARFEEVTPKGHAKKVLAFVKNSASPKAAVKKKPAKAKVRRTR